MIKLKLGKKPFKKDKRDLKLARYIDKTVLPTPPKNTNDHETFSDWLMLLNDQIGDCGIAGVYHLIKLWSEQGNKEFEFTDDQVLEIYRIISGYDPSDPSTDVGVYLRDVLQYWKKTGVPDKDGNLNKIAAYALLDQKDHEEVKIAQYLFSGLYIGFEVPAFAMDAFSEGKIWDVQDYNNNVEGGHCVDPMGYGKPSAMVTGADKEGVYVITWGAVQFMTWEFWDEYVDECWCVFNELFLDNDKSPDGFNSNQLVADLKALGNEGGEDF